MEKTLSIGITVDGGSDKRVHYSSIELPAKDYEIEDSLQAARGKYGENFLLDKDVRLEIESVPLLPSLEYRRITARTFDELNFLAKRLAYCKIKYYNMFYQKIRSFQNGISKKYIL